jgi:hypothetical protein
MTTDQERVFKLGAHEYRAGRLDAFQQLHVASEWRDVALGLAFAKKNRLPEVTDEQFRQAVLVVVTGGLGRVTAQSRDEVTHLLLSVVTRQQKGATGVGWARVTNAAGGMMFSDVELSQLVPILYEVLDHNGIVDFFSGGLSDSGPTAE